MYVQDYVNFCELVQKKSQFVEYLKSITVHLEYMEPIFVTKGTKRFGGRKVVATSVQNMLIV